jgi:hypothetical protein
MPQRQLRVAFAALLTVVVAAIIALRLLAPTGDPGTHLFCFWNVENFFDDQDDGRKGPGDKEFDPWMARNPEALRLKLDKLTGALLRMNGGKGPDMLDLVEVESVRAVELLRDALNSKLENTDLHYKYLAMKELTSGRHIAPAVLSRLPVEGDGRLIGKRLRILRADLKVNGHELILLVGHWTSRLERAGADKDHDDKRRAVYADEMYGEFRAIVTAHPDADVLLCGDFNDTPEDEAVARHLHATANAEAVRAAPRGDAARAEPKLLHLFAGKEPGEFGTHYYSGKWYIFDHILVSRGLLDGRGWSCDPASAATFKDGLTRAGDRQGRPWRFGSERDKGPRGYSDHFPVTVRLAVAGAP